jgi:SHS family lactate transporter-like MFS transporter
MAPYFLRSWIPKRETRDAARPLFTVLSELTWLQWAQFWTGYVIKQKSSFLHGLIFIFSLSSRWLAWCCDSIDFFSVILAVPLLQKQFDKALPSAIVRIFGNLSESKMMVSYNNKTTAVTLTLLFRPAGAVRPLLDGSLTNHPYLTAVAADVWNLVRPFW